ncbi:DNA polymerase III subunit alpha [Buchnera aphidicola (Neophyllaphis podocarpi)]|uniref:DNA polymerase III subunit alpha n=1 Tax=Buchnera aphidicola TaxID=9 RepID=UPI0034639F9B
MKNPKFIHLRVHSDYSLINGLSKPESIINKAVEIGMPAIALNDLFNLSGIIKFYRHAHIMGIKPIIGVDFKVYNKLLKNTVYLTILAINSIGYKNIISLTSEAYNNIVQFKDPTIKYSDLVKYNQGLIILSGGIYGDIGKSILIKNKHFINLFLEFYKKYFLNFYYIDISRINRKHEVQYFNDIIYYALKYKIPLVATNEVCFLNKNDFSIHQIKVKIQENSSLNLSKSFYDYTENQFMKTEKEMLDLFSDIPESLQNSVEIAKRCNLIIPLYNHFLPIFPTKNISNKNFLVKKAKKGLINRFKNSLNIGNNKDLYLKYFNRLNYELKVINKMGFSSYFLVVMEFIKWSKYNNIPVGPGRGSGAGSLVAYALEITEIDPIYFDLLFERFLNLERTFMPDFDIDFCMDRRDEVIDHVSKVYGRESVSQIVTFGTMAAKAVIRDVGRALGYPYGFLNKISKLIPLDPGITLRDAFINESKLLNMYSNNKEVKVLFDKAVKLEGTIRNIGKHAGGVVISPTKITDFSPTYLDLNTNNPITQFDKNDIEIVGLVKFDFLGLRTLTIIHNTLNIINNRLKLHKKIDLNSLNLNDHKCFKQLQNANTTAVFQLESKGMKDLIMRLKPDSFEDIVALLALFRPGPLQSGMVDNFINRKHGIEKIYYPDENWQHESLKPILNKTYGIILYQEQVMQIAQVLAGYTLSEADLLRIAMGKKNPKEMSKQKFIFQQGAKKKGICSKLSIKIFNLVEKFAGYGFNKSHSVAYALISYQTLWLKVYYTSDFMAASMSSDIDNINRLVLLVNECKQLGINVNPPNINLGNYNFTVNKDNSLIYGMGAIKGIGSSTIDYIIKIRKTDGIFLSLLDFCLRVNPKKITKKIIEKLILSGAFDFLNIYRSHLIDILEYTLKISNQYNINKNIGQIDIFSSSLEDLFYIKLKSISLKKSWTEEIKLDKEYEVLGLYLTGNPISEYISEIESYIAKCIFIKDIKSINANKVIIISGIIISIKIKITKNNKNIGIMLFDDLSGRIEVILYNHIIEKYSKFLNKNNILVIKGKVSLDRFNSLYKIIALEIIDITTARAKYVNKICISVVDKTINKFFIDLLSNIFKPYLGGNIPIYIKYLKSNVYTNLKSGNKWLVYPERKLINKLKLIPQIKKVSLNFKRNRLLI